MYFRNVSEMFNAIFFQCIFLTVFTNNRRLTIVINSVFDQRCFMYFLLNVFLSVCLTEHSLALLDRTWILLMFFTTETRECYPSRSFPFSFFFVKHCIIFSGRSMYNL